jgi:hypothetical protein
MNQIERKQFSTPLVQMNVDSDRIFDTLIDMHWSNLHVEFWEHRGFRGAMLYFERLSKPHLVRRLCGLCLNVGTTGLIN